MLLRDSGIKRFRIWRNGIRRIGIRRIGIRRFRICRNHQNGTEPWVETKRSNRQHNILLVKVVLVFIIIVKCNIQNVIHDEEAWRVEWSVE